MRLQQPRAQARVADHYSRRRFALVPLIFLPWRGCSQGGFYDTGVTENCQEIYQPAAAAEKRLKEKLLKQAEEKRLLSIKEKAASKAELELSRREQKEYDRNALDFQRVRNTEQLVRNMWQGLE